MYDLGEVIAVATGGNGVMPIQYRLREQAKKAIGEATSIETISGEIGTVSAVLSSSGAMLHRIANAVDEIVRLTLLDIAKQRSARDAQPSDSEYHTKDGVVAGLRAGLAITLMALSESLSHDPQSDYPLDKEF